MKQGIAKALLSLCASVLISTQALAMSPSVVDAFLCDDFDRSTYTCLGQMAAEDGETFVVQPGDQLTFLTSIATEKSDTVYHIWDYLPGGSTAEVDTVPAFTMPLDVEPSGGFRTFSVKTLYPLQQPGLWRVSVQDTGGEIIKTLTFTVAATDTVNDAGEILEPVADTMEDLVETMDDIPDADPAPTMMDETFEDMTESIEETVEDMDTAVDDVVSE